MRTFHIRQSLLCLHRTGKPSLLHMSAKLDKAVHRHSQSPPLSQLKQIIEN